MTSPIDNEALAPGDTGARLPALGSPELSPAFLSKVKEILESLLGRRGSHWDQAVTFRALYQAGLVLPATGANGWQGNAPAGAGSAMAVLRSQLENDLRNSEGFKNLQRRIGSIDDLAGYPEEIRAQLESSLVDLARQRQADLVTIERKIQSSNLSFASRLEEITAALDSAAAGVRRLDSAYADKTGSLAASVNQVQAQLGSNPGDGVTVEEKLVAQASDITGLKGQWSIKIQAGSDANPVIAGIDLSATSPSAGAGTSALTILADKLGVFTSGGAVMPFGVDATGAYINGLLRVNASGTALQDVAAGARRLELGATSQVFQIAKSGSNAPSSISLSARALNLAGSPNWTIPAGTATLAAGSDAWNKTLTFANMTSDTVQIQVAQDGLTDTITIIKVREGTDAINGLLTNEAANVATAADGSGANYAGTGGTFKVFDGVTDKTGDAAVTYSVAAATGVTISIAATGVYSITAMSADTGSATLRAVYKGVTIDKVYSIARSKAGAAGVAAYVSVSGQQVFSRATSAAAFAPASITLTATPYGGAAAYQWQYWTGAAWSSIAGATAATYAVASGDFADQRTYRVQATIGGTVYTDQITLVQVTGGTSAVTGFLTNEAVTLAADSAGTVASFAPAGGTFKVYDGITDKTGNAAVAYSVASNTGCTVTITAAGAYSVSAMSADTASATLQAVYNGVMLALVLSLAKSKSGNTGARGAGHWYANGSAWSDATADAACPGGKVTGDVVTISSGSYVMTKRWGGASWDVLSTVIDGTLLVSGSVLAAALAAGSVTTEKMLISGSNLIPNSDFATGDFTNWRPFGTPANSSVIPASTAGTPTGAKSANVCKMLNGAGGQVSIFAFSSAYADTNAPRDGFAVTEGEQYNIKIDMAKTSDLSASTLAVVVYFYKSDGTHSSSILVLDLHATLTTSFATYSGSFTVPAGALRCWPYVNFVGTAGSVYWSNLRCARMADSALVVDGGIKANHISVTSLAAMNINTGALTVNDLLTIAAGGAIASGQTAYDTGTGYWWGLVAGVPKFSIGQAGGPSMKWDGTNLFVSKATFDNLTAAISGTLPTSVANGTVSYGSLTAAGSGGTVQSYLWSVIATLPDGSPANATISAGGTTATATFTGNATNMQIQLSIRCTITFTDGRTATVSQTKNITHGTYAP